jgi:phosphopentomutase
MQYGHRRDLPGYARVLEEFDEWLGEFMSKVMLADLVLITADHGNDPTFRGTDHTREQVPLFVLHHHEARALGTRKTYADIAATLGDYFQVPGGWPVGESFLSTSDSRPYEAQALRASN